MSESRLEKQINFIVEIDKVKEVIRQNFLVDGSRKENDAEHSWHIAVMAFILQEYYPEKVDLLKVIKMTLMHDLVEIDAGDTYCYDEKAVIDKQSREQKAAERIYRILPPEQAVEYMALWAEFEECATPEAKYAAILDRMQPLLLNMKSHGKSWKEHGVTREQVMQRTKVIRDNSEILWSVVEGIIQEAIKRGYLA